MKTTPVLFVGHGSPMNAIADNDYTKSLAQLRNYCANPKAILCISAHWLTAGTSITGMSQPPTIHDFGGFPKELFEIQYPAPGSPEIAESIAQTITKTKVNVEKLEWGLDHGCWATLLHIFPETNIPTLQLSIDIAKPPEYHFEIGQQLRQLRDQGILILGSGNIVHNLRMLNWDTQAKPLAWATEFDEFVKEALIRRDFKTLLTAFQTSQAGRLSVPTTEHYYPMLYVLGASDPEDKLVFQYEKIDHGSIAMRTFGFIPPN